MIQIIQVGTTFGFFYHILEYYISLIYAVFRQNEILVTTIGETGANTK